MYLTVYATRYLDVLFIFHIRSLIQVYNLIMKIFFITSQMLIIHSIAVKYRATYNPKLDTFKVEAVVVPCAVLAIFIQSHSGGIFNLIREVINHYYVIMSLYHYVIISLFSIFGLFQSYWNQSPFYPKCSNYKKPGKPKPSPPITSSA